MGHKVLVDGEWVAKRTGASHTAYVPTSGKNKGKNQYVTNGWCFYKGDFISYSCVTTSESKPSTKSKNGDVWFGSVACTRLNKNTGEETLLWGSMHKKTGKVVIDKIDFIVNPSSPNGGYCGTFRQKKSK